MQQQPSVRIPFTYPVPRSGQWLCATNIRSNCRKTKWREDHNNSPPIIMFHVSSSARPKINSIEDDACGLIWSSSVKPLLSRCVCHLLVIWMLIKVILNIYSALHWGRKQNGENQIVWISNWQTGHWAPGAEMHRNPLMVVLQLSIDLNIYVRGRIRGMSRCPSPRRI